MTILFALCAAWTVLSLSMIVAGINEARGQRVTIKVADE